VSGGMKPALIYVADFADYQLSWIVRQFEII
jgi:hypothetical protein